MSFEVEVQPSGHRITVEEGETILDAALRQNVGLPYGCRNGVCGSCKGRLLEGAVSYPEGPADALELEDEDICLTCKAVPASNLVVELGEVEMAAEIQVKTLPTRVVQVEHLNHDVVRLQLKLPDEQRLAICLHVLEGRSLEETAAIIGRTPGAVRALIYRAKQQLREGLGRASAWLSNG